MNLPSVLSFIAAKWRTNASHVEVLIKGIADIFPNEGNIFGKSTKDYKRVVVGSYK